MAEEKKEAKKPETPETPHTPEHEIPKAFKEKKEAPWEHFKKSASFKKMQGHGAQHMNRRTGGKGG